MALLLFQEPRQVRGTKQARIVFHDALFFMFFIRIVFHDKDSTYQQLLGKAETTSLYNQRIQSMLTTIYKCLHFANYPKYLKKTINCTTVYLQS